MFEIKNLHAAVEGKKILNGVSFRVKPGEIHAIMGPNGSGKTTLANTVMGHHKYKITKGDIRLNNKSILSLKTDARARKGIFLAFQHPKEIAGVTVAAFLKTAVSSMHKAAGKPQINPFEFSKLLRSKMEKLSLPAKFITRYLNEGFSGGEKKKLEILQMTLLKPVVAILDEPDSGLDLDALKIVAKGIKSAASEKRGIIIFTHYQRILRHIKPHFVHIMMNGRIVKSGGHELSHLLEQKGYDWLK